MKIVLNDGSKLAVEGVRESMSIVEADTPYFMRSVTFTAVSATLEDIEEKLTAENLFAIKFETDSGVNCGSYAGYALQNASRVVDGAENNPVRVSLTKK